MWKEAYILVVRKCTHEHLENIEKCTCIHIYTSMWCESLIKRETKVLRSLKENNMDENMYSSIYKVKTYI